MKKKNMILYLLLAMVLLVGGCGTSSEMSMSEPTSKGDSAQNSFTSNAAGANADMDAAESESGEYSEDGVEAADEAALSDEAEGSDTASKNEKATANETRTVSKEMLVYRGSLVIDSLKFEQSVSDFKKLIDTNNGFVEKEAYTDNKSLYSGYYQEDSETSSNKRYSATVRVPSANYETVMSQTGDLGDLRTRNSNVTNVTQQYSTYQSELEIYQAEYERYLALLEKATDDKYALEIQKQLFDIQVKIADLKSSMTNLQTDVAYSYIDVEICEVKKYQDEPAKDDTFLDRLKNVCQDSIEGLLSFLEGVLFFIIRTWYGFAFFALVVWIIVLIIKAIIRRAIRKKEKKANGKSKAAPKKAATENKTEPQNTDTEMNSANQTTEEQSENK